MPLLEQRPSFLFKHLEASRFVAFPHYEASLPQHTDLTGKKVYLIHLHTPYKHAKHYLGFSENVQGRVQHHRRTLYGGDHKRRYFLACVAYWDGGRELEAALKTWNI